MRLSADKTDPAFNMVAFMGTVKLDGVEIKNCVTADEELGEAHCYVKKDGRLITDNKGFPLREIKHGKVEIIIPDGVL